MGVMWKVEKRNSTASSQAMADQIRN